MTETIKASLSFIIILILLMIAFANLMSLSERYTTGKEIHFTEFAKFWFDGYLIETGGLDPGDFSTLSSFVYIMISFIGAIVMINMLIAIMTDTWAWVS